MVATLERPPVSPARERSATRSDLTLTVGFLRDTSGMSAGSLTLFDKLERVVRADLKTSVREFTGDEIRFLVDSYYQAQEMRLANDERLKALHVSGARHQMMSWMSLQLRRWEGHVQTALSEWCRLEESGLADWCLSLVGIGPVITAGLMAHIDLARAPYAGNLWSYAGLDPSKTWGKGQKRPWNARLKVLCVGKLGESFVKFQNHKRAPIYSRIYQRQKARIAEANERGEYADVAAKALATRTLRRGTPTRAAYEAGKLPDGRVHARARRAAVKVFLSHYHEVGRWLMMRELAPEPYAIAHLGHVRDLVPPHLDLVPGLAEARRVAGRPWRSEESRKE